MANLIKLINLHFSFKRDKIDSPLGSIKEDLNNTLTPLLSKQQFFKKADEEIKPGVLHSTFQAFDNKYLNTMQGTEVV